MGGDSPFAHLQVLFRVVADALSQLVGMGQKEVDVEGARPIQYLDRRGEGGMFVRIGSSLVSLAKGKQQFRGTSGMAPCSGIPYENKRS